MKDELAKRLRQLAVDIESAVAKLGLDEKQRQLADLEEQVSRPELWNNPDHAQMVARELSSLKSIVQPWKVLQAQANDAIELLDIIDDELADEFAGQVQAMEKTFAELKQQLMFDGKYDAGDAILRLSSGVGGDDAQDFTEMLERMYLRWAEQNGFTTSVIERSPGEQAGVKTSVIEVSGPYAYGWLKSENGVG